ncbi:S41 family peptidase [Streptacidiphilus sp. MAP5-3]|uniref:S41 family peptidase n=1 Tax=unclassified Streptacidiphilus TaxID=2643834 RepID=UPI003513AE9A
MNSTLDHVGIVERTADLVTAHYVFPEQGDKIAAQLRAALAAGRYTEAGAAGDVERLGALVTEDLQSVNGDKHLRLAFHADEVPDGQDAAAGQMMERRSAESCGGVPRFELLEGGVAVLELAPIIFPLHLSADSLTAAMTLAAQARALVVDLRRNEGGDPHTVQYLCSYFFDQPTHINTQYWREGDQEEQSWTLPHVPGRRLGQQKPVYLLTSATTFSGAEELAYDLQQLGRAVVVGERTKGGAHPRNGWTVHPHLEATIPVGRSINPTSGTDWEGTGITPDIEVPAAQALDRAHREALGRLAENR